MSSDASSTWGKILFVDDEENILRALRRLFTEEDCEVFIATSGTEALRLLEDHHDIGVIVSDQRMPGMSGVDFLEKTKDLLPLSVRILLTGYADIHAVVEAINRGGAFRYITKPWNDEELVQTIKEAAGRYALVKENLRLTEIIRKQNKELKKWSSELELMVQEQTEDLQKSYDLQKKLNKRLQSNFKSTIMAFSGLLELRDQRMRSHAGNVADLARRVAKTLDVPAEERETVVIAALLHDIGKIGIPDLMLQKTVTSMSPEELQEYAKHSVRGQAAIDSIEDLRKAGVLIRHHHERYDGTGFPDGLRAEAIPIGARIIAIADFIDKELRNVAGEDGADQILNMIKEERGKGFDPKLISLFEEPVKETYKSLLRQTGVTEFTISAMDLRENMVISRDAYSGTGILLMRKGTRLTKTNIQVLQRYCEVDPATGGIFVLTRG